MTETIREARRDQEMHEWSWRVGLRVYKTNGIRREAVFNMRACRRCVTD